ncbi:MAG TPA: MFS transporter [Nevskiaceae bacterium]|nr:MFS transporter [Nevskiaceae bacterium]
MAVALAMMSVDSTIVATALRAIQHELDAPITWTGWTLTAFALGLVLALPIAGKLSESRGRRRVFLASMAIFTGASLCCGLTTNIYVLVALRFVQALGGAGFTPSATGIIVDYFGPGRDKALGLFEGLFAAGAMTGPIFGGLFVTYASWRWIFWVNVPIGIALIVLCLRVVPRDPPVPTPAAGHFDLLGLTLLGVNVLGAMLAFNALGRGLAAASTPAFIVPAVIAAAALALFGRHTVKHPKPFIAVRFMVGRGFMGVNLINVGGGLVEGVIALVPLYAMNRYHLSPLASGTLLTAEGAVVVVMSSTAALLLRRTGYRPPIYAGLAVTVVGVVGLALDPIHLSPWLWLATATGIIGFGVGITSPASRNAGLQLDPASAPTLAALRTMCFCIGSIATVSITTALIAETAHPGLMHADANLLWAALLLLLLPAVRAVPEHRGAW